MESKLKKDLQLLLKLGFDDALSKEALKKSGGDVQSAINYAINQRKQTGLSQSQQVSSGGAVGSL